MTPTEKKVFEEFKTSVIELVVETRLANERGKKVYERVFEDNGKSLISEVRVNKNSIENIQDSLKNIGKTGKKIKGIDTGDIWKYGFRFATILAYIVATILGINFTLN